MAIAEVQPGRRAGKSIAETPKRGLLLRLALYSPKDTIAATVATAAIVAIVVNATWLQAGRHPSPMFGTTSAPVASVVAPQVNPLVNPLPRPRPLDAEIKADIPAVPAKAPPAATPRNDPLANLIVSSQRVATVQRALTDYGYGQIKPTGAIGSETQAAIQRFERERKLPITGQMSDRLVRELGLATGKPLE